MENLNLKELVAKCNEYIKDNYTSKEARYVECYKGIKEAFVRNYNVKVEVVANEVYRSNGTSENKSVRIDVIFSKGYCGNYVDSIKIPSNQQWKTITKKIDKMIAVANEHQDEVNVPENKYNDYKFFTNFEDVKNWMDEHKSKLCIFRSVGETIEGVYNEKLSQAKSWLS